MDSVVKELVSDIFKVDIFLLFVYKYCQCQL